MKKFKIIRTALRPGCRSLLLPLCVLVCTLSCDFFPRENPDDPKSGSYSPSREIVVKVDALTVPGGGAYDFGNKYLDSTTEVQFRIQNSGADTVELTGTPLVTIGGNHPSCFTVTDMPDASIAPGASTNFILAFATDTSGLKEALVTIEYGTQGQAFSFTVQGTGSGICVVDSGMDVGSHSSIAVSGSGIYIAYRDENNDKLKFARSTDSGATWPAENILVVGEDDDVGTYASIFAEGGSVYISYYQLVSGGYADTWINFTKSTDYGVTWPAGNIRNVADISWDGLYSSVAGSGSTVLLSYYNDVSDVLHCIRSTDSGDTWLSGNDITVDATGNTGTYNDIVICGSCACISYYDVTNSSLKCAVSADTGASWSAENIRTVDATGTVGEFTSIGAYETHVYISYYDRTNGALKFARSTDNGATWPDEGSLPVIDGEGDTGQYTSLAVDGATLYISYYDVTNGDLKFARSDDSGATWPPANLRVVDSSGEVGKYCSIDCSGDNVYISYYNDTVNKLKFARSKDRGDTW